MRASSFTPREIVGELDRYIIGQHQAKRAVAIALRNRWRRQQVSEELRDEIAPKNIIMIGPTGVGKTEIARRLAKLAAAPFIKVEASKFTEVGYVGRDVDSMIRDLAEMGIQMVREEEKAAVEVQAQGLAEERLLDLLVPPGPKFEERATPDTSTREKFRAMLRAGELDERQIELESSDRNMPMFKLFSNSGVEEMGVQLQDLFQNLPFGGGGGAPGGARKKKRKVPVPLALKLLQQEEAARLIDMDKVQQEAVRRVEQSGIVFLDEIDKIASAQGPKMGPDISREGVQRDILPIVEGSTVTTKYGPVRTDHILFIAAGAFNVSKPSDLIPELQGRFPIRVELQSLKREDLARILTEPKNSLVRQYVALLATEGIELTFEPDAVLEMSAIAAQVNESTENIGARRLHTIMEKLLDDISFTAPERAERKITINAAYVREKLTDITKNEDLSRYIL